MLHGEHRRLIESRARAYPHHLRQREQTAGDAQRLPQPSRFSPRRDISHWLPPDARASPLPRVTPREPAVNAAERETTRIPSSRREEGTVEAGGALVLPAIIQGGVEGVVQQAVQRFGGFPRKADAPIAVAALVPRTRRP